MYYHAQQHCVAVHCVDCSQHAAAKPCKTQAEEKCLVFDKRARRGRKQLLLTPCCHASVRSIIMIPSPSALLLLLILFLSGSEFVFQCSVIALLNLNAPLSPSLHHVFSAFHRHRFLVYLFICYFIYRQTASYVWLPSLCAISHCNSLLFPSCQCVFGHRS